MQEREKEREREREREKLATVLSLWDFSLWKFGLLSPGKASCERAALPNLRYILGVLVFLLNSPNSDMDHRIFNVRTGVNACGCTRRCTDTVRKFALEN